MFSTPLRGLLRLPVMGSGSRPPSPEEQYSTVQVQSGMRQYLHYIHHLKTHHGIVENCFIAEKSMTSKNRRFEEENNMTLKRKTAYEVLRSALRDITVLLQI